MERAAGKRDELPLTSLYLLYDIVLYCNSPDRRLFSRPGISGWLLGPVYTSSIMPSPSLSSLLLFVAFRLLNAVVLRTFF